MAYDTTYAYINCPGSSSDNLCNGPHLAGAIRFAASRENVYDTSVTITCKVWLGFGSYGTTTQSVTSNSVQARCWVGTDTYDNTASAQKDSVTINSAGTTWKCTSNSLTRLTTAYSCLTQTAKATHKSNTDDLQMTVSNWTSGSKTMSFRLWHNGSTSTTTKKTVSLAAPEYHADVTITLNANGGTIDTNSA